MSKVSIKDYCEITSSKRIFANEYLTSGIPFYRGKEISEKYKSSSEVSDLIYISKEKYDEIKAKYGVPQKGDLLLTSVGTIGNPYLVKDNKEFYFKDGNLTWFRNFIGMNSKWFYYWLLSPQGRSELNKYTIGSSQKAYTINLLYRLQLDLPDIETQTRITSIISTYDNLIENNEKRIKILEEMAQRLYTEWFAKFKFPGYEKVKMVDSGTEYGIIPEGWEVKRFGDLVRPQYGYTASAVSDNNLPKYLRGTDINKNSYIDWAHVPNCSIRDTDLTKYRVNKYDVFIIRMADPGKIGICEQEINAVFASYLMRLNILKKLTPYYLYYFAISERYQGYVLGASGGTTRKSINSQQVCMISVLLPNKEILDGFENKVVLTREELTKLIQQNNVLSKTRDLLIPQLITGKSEVRNV